MKPVLRYQDCIDHDPIETWIPSPGEDVDYSLCLHIGPANEKGTDMFYVHIYSSQSAGRIGRSHQLANKRIVVQEYSWSNVMSSIAKILDNISGKNWTDLTKQLAQCFDWEFDNYKPYAN